MGGAGSAEGEGRPVTLIVIPAPEHARVVAMGQLSEARTHLVLAERMLEAAGPQHVPAEVVPRVRAAREQVEQLALIVASLDAVRQQ